MTLKKLLSMGESKETNLYEIIDLIGGGTPKTSVPEYWNGDIPWLSVADFNNGKKYVFETEKTITEEGLNNSSTKLLNKGDIIISARGTVGVVAVLGKEMTFNQSCYGIRAKSDFVTTEYVYYLLKDTILGFLQMAHGGVFDTITRDTFKEIEISLPPLPEQRAIAAILSSLDDKIDLLLRQNATLEKMAETLFRQWFVEEAREEWETKPLGNLVTVKRGGSPRPIQDYLADSGLRWLKISDATKENSPFIFEIKEFIRPEGLNKTTHLNAGTLVLSNSATPGIPKILQVDTCIHDGWLHFPKSTFSNEYLYLLFKFIRPELLQQGNGSIFTNLKTDILKEFPVHVPDKATLEVFNIQVKGMFDKMLKNQIQIRTLTALRDTLLPKLMNGEVRVDSMRVETNFLIT
jgi:type I restriction enzyme, S subunit